MNIDVQIDGRRDVPIALNDFAVGIQAQDVRGGYFSPRQFPRVGQVGAVFLLDSNVASNVIVVALSVQHSAKHGHLLMRRQLWQQGSTPRPGCVLRQQLKIQIIFHGHRNGSFKCNFL